MENRTKGKMKISNNILVRWIFIGSGVLLTAVGIIGMFVPLLPTTIFLILAAWCFARSSETFYRLLHTNKLFGKYLSNYRSGNGMTLRSKILSLAVLWIGIGYSAIFVTELSYVRIILLAIGAGVTWHLLAIKTYREEKK